MVADDKFHIGIFSGDNLTHPADPDRAVQHPNALHLEHELVLRQGGVVRLKPVQTLGRANFLNVDKFEERLEVVVPLPHV